MHDDYCTPRIGRRMKWFLRATAVPYEEPFAGQLISFVGELLPDLD